MRISLIFLILLFAAISYGQSTSPPIDRTDHYGLRMYAQHAVPSADSLNQNLRDIDAGIFSASLNIANAITIQDSVVKCDTTYIFQKTINADQRFLLDNMSAGQMVYVKVTALGSNQVTWVDNVYWANGSAPVQTFGSTDVYAFVKFGDGVTVGWKFANFGTTVPEIPAAPVLLSPTNNATGVSITALLDWSDVTAATSYNVQVSASVAFGTTVVNQTGLSTSQYTISPALDVTTKYYWRVSATNSEGTSAYSNIDSFTTTTPSAATIVYYDRPYNYQLYTRSGGNTATVTLSGQIQTTGYDSMYVELYRGDSLQSRAGQILNYSGSNAGFNLNRTINVGLNSHKFLLYVKYGAVPTLVLTVDSIVCGDAYVIAGQSNAQAPTSDITYSSPWARTFGIQTDSLNTKFYNPADTTWSRSSCNYDSYESSIDYADNNPSNVGALGMQLQRYLIDSLSIPSVVINGARHSTAITAHLRDNGNPTNATTYYGKTLYRVQKSRVSHIKSVIWWQGESEVASSALVNAYAGNFATLRTAWYENFPNLENIYLMQTRPLACNGTSDYAQEFREVQRQLGITYSDVQVMATMGIGGYYTADPSINCHYASAGYIQLAGHVFQRLNQAFYTPSDPDTTNLRPPSVRKAFFKGSAKTKIGVLFNGSYPVGIPSDTLASGNIRNYFYLGKEAGFTSSIISSVTMSTDTLYLNLSSGTTATRLACYPDIYASDGSTIYNGAWIRNARGLAMLGFDNVPIMEPESDSLFQLMTTADLPRQIEMDSLIKLLKGYNVFNGDFLYIYANADTGLAHVNWLTGKRDSFRCIPNGGAIFTPDMGYTGNGTTAYLNTQYRPSPSGVSYTLNSGSVAVYVAEEIITNGLDKRPFGVRTALTNSYLGIVPKDSLYMSGGNHKFYTNINDASALVTGAAVTNNNGSGLFLTNRTTASLVTAYRNGAIFGYTNAAQTAEALAVNPIYVLAYNHTVGSTNTAVHFYTGRVTMLRIGGAWNTTQIADFYSAIQWWMTKRGAAWNQ